jgi:ABC-type sugar transport system permease subunit
MHTPWQQKVFTKLIGLQYKILYRKGAENGAADALSRYPSTQLAAISFVSGWKLSSFLMLMMLMLGITSKTLTGV